MSHTYSLKIHHYEKEIIFSILDYLYISVVVFAQSTLDINYKQIEKYIKKHPTDFETLLNRYETNDSLLTNQDYTRLFICKQSVNPVLHKL